MEWGSRWHKALKEKKTRVVECKSTKYKINLNIKVGVLILRARWKGVKEGKLVMVVVAAAMRMRRANIEKQGGDTAQKQDTDKNMGLN